MAVHSRGRAEGNITAAGEDKMQEKIAELKKIITTSAGENSVALLWIAAITPDERKEHIRDIYFGKMCGYLEALHDMEKINGSTKHRAEKTAESIRWSGVEQRSRNDEGRTK